MSFHVEFEPGANKTLHLDQASATGGRLLARLDTSDALATDNSAMAVLPTRRPINVALVTPGSVFLKSALESIPLVDLKLFQQELPKVEEGQPAVPVNFVLPENVQRSITLLHRLVPAQLPPGKLLIINPQTDSDLWTVGKPIEQPLVATVSEQSPVTQHVKLTNVLFPDARSLTFTGEAELLIKTPLDEPLLAYIRRPTGEVLVLNVDLDQGDLPLRIAFPVMMKNALEWFDGSTGELQQAIATGGSTQVVLPKLAAKTANETTAQPEVATKKADEPTTETAELEQSASSKDTSKQAVSDVNQYWMRDPRGQLTPLTSDAETATLSVMKLSGLWSVGTKADLENDPWNSEAKEIPNDSSQEQVPVAQRLERLRHLACNLSSREESDLRPRTELKSADQFGLLSLGGRSIWFYCVLAALALAAVEWWLYQRRIVG